MKANWGSKALWQKKITVKMPSLQGQWYLITCTLANESVDVIRVVWSAHLFVTLSNKWTVKKNGWLRNKCLDIKGHPEERRRKQTGKIKILVRSKVHENKDLASLLMESTMPGRVADTKVALKNEWMIENSQNAKES